MRQMITVLGFALFIAIVLSGCTETVTDTVTEEKIKVIERTDPALTKIKVRTDGMVSDTDYGSAHPFVLNSEVLADMKYYERNTVSRGDIVVFKTKNNKAMFGKNVAIK